MFVEKWLDVLRLNETKMKEEAERIFGEVGVLKTGKEQGEG